MKLIIERAGNKSGSQFKLMNGDTEFCRTSSRKNAALIKAIFKDKNSPIPLKAVETPYFILSDILQKTGIDLTANFSQKREIVDIRFIYCKIAADAGFSQTEIGEPISRNRVSVLNAVAKFNDFYETDRKFRELYHRIKL